MPRLAGEPNPALINQGPRHLAEAPPMPLVMIHDGGGTTFSYHCMERTNRTMYGIHNAHFDAGGWWDDGIPEMATHYLALLAEAIPEGGPILLGGWSMGGLLALEMAHQNSANRGSAKQSRFRIVGIIMVDTTYPGGLAITEPQQHANTNANVVVPTSSSSSSTTTTTAATTERIIKPQAELDAMKLKDLVALNMTHARAMISRWAVPEFGADFVPPTILLRAVERVADPGAAAFIDRDRDDRMLGWKEYDRANDYFIRDVVDVGGSHFTMFEEKHIQNISREIYKAADILAAPKIV